MAGLLVSIATALQRNNLVEPTVNPDQPAPLPPGPRPYPGPPHAAPKIHHAPECLHHGGWHDIAGALTFKGHHHVFQGCPHGVPVGVTPPSGSWSGGGWSHARSEDFVTWKDEGIHLAAVRESFEGMASNNSPCSGFLTLQDGAPCAGYMQLCMRPMGPCMRSCLAGKREREREREKERDGIAAPACVSTSPCFAIKRERARARISCHMFTSVGCFLLRSPGSSAFNCSVRPKRTILVARRGRVMGSGFGNAAPPTAPQASIHQQARGTCHWRCGAPLTVAT